MNSLLLDALHCSNNSRPPVWLMRQAGRYMPQYRKLRERYSLWEMFHQPELAAEITLLPIIHLDVDAAIVFSDILVIAESLGLQIDFPHQQGPRVVPSITSKEQIDQLALLDVPSTLHFVFKTISLIKPQLKVPLIGFCGGPFTVATYLLDSTSSSAFVKTKSLIQNDPSSFRQLLEKITLVSITYLKAQIQAGVQVVQIFDSWANILSLEQFHIFCLPFLQQIIEEIRELAPVIIFCRDSSLRHVELSHLRPACISLDEQKPISELRSLIPSSIAVQGNIPPDLLKCSLNEIRIYVDHFLSSMRDQKGFIVNLAHGVLPEIPFDHVRYFVKLVKESF